MTNNRSHHLALVLVVCVLAELRFLAQLVPLDLTVYNWIEEQRGCNLSRLLSSEWPLLTLVTLALLLFSYLCYRRRWTEALHGAVVIIVGSLLIELLKTAFERARPSVIPPLLVGNSFPSGHTAGAILLVGTIGYWLLHQRGSRLVKISRIAILSALACAVISQRLYLAHHWLSDVVGTVPLAIAWLCVTLPRIRGGHTIRPIVLAGSVLLISYPLFYLVPSLRIHLPSALSTVQEPLVSFSFGDLETKTLLKGEWGTHGKEAIGSITWMRHGEASLAVSLQEQRGYAMRFSARPFLQKKGFACFPLEVSLNKHPVSNLLLYQGWREYELYIDPAWVTPGVNMLTFRTGSDFPSGATLDQEAVAFHRVALFAEK